MNKLFIAIISFAGGAALGIFATKEVYRERYEQLARDDFENRRAKEQAKKDDGKKDKGKKDKDKLIARDTSSIVDLPRKDKIAYRKAVVPKVQSIPKDSPSSSPYVITPDDFGTKDEYEELSFTYFSESDVLVDDDEQKLSECDMINAVGYDWKNRFGEYEADTVYVRNDRLKTDYEILRSDERYEDFLERHPYLTL